MSKENKKPLSTPSNAEEANGIAQVQDLLHAVQRSLGGAQDKYDVLEADFNKQKAELTEAKSENAKLKKRVQKLLTKLTEKEEEKKGTTENETTSTAAPFRPSRLAEKEEAPTVWLRDVYLNATKRTLPKLIRGKSVSSHAFCVLVMNRDTYALGATVLAHRLKRLNSKADIVCLVTRDVSLGVVEALASEFTAVFQVPYLEYKCQKMTTKKQQKYYGNWIERSFTKWNALALSMYKKVILLDADLLPVSNIDHLFEMSAPAATFSSPWAKTYRKDGYEDPFKGLRHGDRVDNDRIKNAIQYSLKHSERVENKGAYLALGSVVLLEPSVASYGIFNAFVCSQQPFGIPGCHSGFDEQSIVLFYYLQNPETQWTHISQGYNALCWHENWLEGCDVKCYHYFNAKPWEMRPDMYPDLRMWYQAMYELSCENSQSGYLAEVCMTDTSFLDVYIKMTSDTIGANGEALCDGVVPLKPVLPHDGASEGSSTSSPRVVDRKSTKPPTSGSRNKHISSSPTEETVDPPKIDGPRSDKASSVCSDKSSKLSETASVRSRESNRSAVLSSSQKQRMAYYDEYERHAQARDHMSRSRHSADRVSHGPAVLGMAGGLDDFATVYGRDGLLRKSVPLRSDPYNASEYRRLKKYDSRRDYGKDLMPQPRVTSEVWIPKSRVGIGYASEGMYERARHTHALSHSPVNTRSLSRFESFGSSTSSGSYRLPVTPKHDRRHHF